MDAYVITNIGWEYNDEHYYVPDGESGVPAGYPARCFVDHGKAVAYLDGLERKEWRKVLAYDKSHMFVMHGGRTITPRQIVVLENVGFNVEGQYKTTPPQRELSDAEIDVLRRAFPHIRFHELVQVPMEDTDAP